LKISAFIVQWACEFEATLHTGYIVFCQTKQLFPTRMRGKAQPDGRPAVDLIETPVLPK